MHGCLFEDIHVVILKILAMLDNDPLEIDNPINIFRNYPKHCFISFLSIKCLCIFKVLDLSMVSKST